MSRDRTPTQEEDRPNRKIQRNLFQAFAVVTFIFVLAIALLLPYRLYERDVHESRAKAREISELIRVGLLSTMITSGESEDVRGLIATYQKAYDFEFRMIRSRHVEKQHGVKEDEQATDDLVREVLATGRSKDDWVDRTTFRYVAPFISDERCQECHESTTGDEIGVGEVLGASELVFDLSRKESVSVRLIVDVVLVMAAALITMGSIFYLIVKKGILEPKVWVDREDD
ncbi:MAG: hypothetical protein GY723_05665 [bacterium]|nr:hypothetical protein [bacterium]MCP5070376.1 hypothetical protein [bacterium]